MILDSIYTCGNDGYNRFLESHLSFCAAKSPDCPTGRKSMSTNLINTVTSAHTHVTQISASMYAHMHKHEQIRRTFTDDETKAV